MNTQSWIIFIKSQLIHKLQNIARGTFFILNYGNFSQSFMILHRSKKIILIFNKKIVWLIFKNYLQCPLNRSRIKEFKEWFSHTIISVEDIKCWKSYWKNPYLKIFLNRILFSREYMSLSKQILNQILRLFFMG